MSDLGTVDVCLTCTHSQIGGLARTIKSIFSQAYGAVRVNLYISHDASLDDKGTFYLPPDLLEMQNRFRELFCIQYTQNIGPYRKLLPYLQENWGRSKLVVTADADTVYPTDWLLKLLSAYQSVGCSVAHRGFQIVIDEVRFAPFRKWLRSTIDHNPSRLIVPAGKDGVLYDTAFFPQSVLDVANAMELAPSSEDLWFQWHLAMNGIAVYVIDARSGANYYDERSISANLRQYEEHDRAIDRLDQYFKNIHGFDLKSVGSPSLLEQRALVHSPPDRKVEGDTSEYVMVSDPCFDGVSVASELPAELELSEHWTFALKGHDPKTRGEIKREPLSGLSICWEGKPKLVQLWQDVELRAVSMGPVADVEVKLTVQSEEEYSKLVDYVAIEKKADVGGVQKKLRLKVSREAEDKVFTIRARATAISLEREEYILRIQFNKDPKNIVLRSVVGKFRRHAEGPVEELARAFSMLS